MRIGFVASLVLAVACSVFPDEASDFASDASTDGSKGGSSFGGVGAGGTFPKADAGAAGAAGVPTSGGQGGAGGTGGASGACGGADLTNDPDNCGACGLKCSATNTAFRRCKDSVCDPVCPPGFFDCSETPTSNGCETAASVENCGTCGAVCPAKFLCDTSTGNPQGICVCDDGACGSTGIGCNAKVCSCGSPDAGTTCRVGETCVSGNCRCNGGAQCSALQTCCPEPFGCVNVTTSSLHCGGCGNKCIGGMTCQLGVCACDQDADCNDGGGGTCVSNQCVCKGVTCEKGQRCRSDGNCH